VSDTRPMQRDEFSAAAQRAAGVVAARRRGDDAGAATLMAEFPDAEVKALGFYVVAELALTLLCKETGDSMDTTVQRLNLAIAAGLA
jgi:hypothetical protein